MASLNMFKRTLLGLGLGLGLLSSSACANSFKIKDAPPGFVEVSSSDWNGEAELRMKAPDNVGLNIASFWNLRGGTLAIWADDLVTKLEARGYRLTAQVPVRSANEVPGTRFDFEYAPPGSEDEPKFYTAVLFVTDEWRVVLQLAGKAELLSAHNQDLDRLLQQIKIGGCKLGKEVCKGPQPAPFAIKAAPAAKSSGDDGEAAEGSPIPEPDPIAEPIAEPEPAN